MPKNRRALPVRCGMAGANDASLFPANQKGARVLPFQRQAECQPLCLPVLRTDFRPTTLSVFLTLIYPPTRSTLCDNRIQRERWGNYTILVLKAANSGLSARVSDNRSLHGYCHDLSLQRKEGACFIITIKSYSILLLCIKYIFSCILNI